MNLLFQLQTLPFFTSKAYIYKMKKRVSGLGLLVFVAVSGLYSCEARKAENAEKPVPQVFTPSEETPVTTPENNTVTRPETDSQPAEPAPVKRAPMPTVAELKKVTPSQEAKRALNNDAMQAFRMKPEAFKTFMQSRIPYYRGKGYLKAENDLVRIEINIEEMRIQTAQETFTFPMN